MKFTKIAAVVALAAAGVAHANVNTTLGNAEIFLSVYDDAATKSFLYDTGINVSHLVDGSINANINIGADANWASFVSSVGGIANLNWSVQAIQFQNGINTRFIYSTLGEGASVAAAGTQLTNSAFTITNQNNALQATTAVAGTSEVAVAGSASYYGDNYDFLLADGVSKLSNRLNAGDISFFGAANSNTSKATLKITQLPTPLALANFSTASGSAVLTIGVPVTPAVPEPTTSALALAALAGIGFVARRRAK